MKRNYLWRIAATLLLAVGIPAAAQVTESVEVAAPAMSHDEFRIAPSSPHITRPLVIDNAASVTVAVTSPSQTLSVSLIAPDGSRFHVGDPDTASFESSVSPDPTQPARGANYIANLLTPAAGTWTLDVTETAPITSPVDGMYMTLFDNDVRAVILGGGPTYFAGEKVNLSLVAFDGTSKLHGLTIVAKKFPSSGPVGVPADVVFHDDGMAGDPVGNDGVYTATVLADTAGEFQVGAQIDGTASTGVFERTAATTYKVTPKHAQLTGAFTDRAADLNGDGIAEHIVVAPGGTTLESGQFMTTVRLRGSNGNVMQRTATATLAAGAPIAEVPFDTKQMQQELGVDGPYSVDLVLVDLITPADAVLADRAVSLGNTGAYHLGDFGNDPLHLTGTNTADGVDYNGNGLYDILNVSIGVQTTATGYYDYAVTLRDKNGKEIGSVASWTYLTAGSNTITFAFDGTAIGRNGVDGPYVVGDLLLYGAGLSLVADTVFVTDPFHASQFEGYADDHTPPTLSVSVTPNLLDPPDHKMALITPTITVSDDHDPNPVVTLLSISSNEGQNLRGDGNTSPDITVDASGRIYLRAERSGPDNDRVYTLTWSARDASGNTSQTSATVTVPHDQKKK